VLLGAALPARAGAATYHVYSCRQPSGAPAPADGWGYSSKGAYVHAFDSCAGGGAIEAQVDGIGSHPYGDTGVDTYSAPPETTIRSFSLYRYTHAGPVQPFGAPLDVIGYAYPGSSVVVIDSCAQSTNSCSDRGNPSSPFDAANLVTSGGPLPDGTNQLILQAVCGGAPGGTCPATSGEAAEIRTYAVNVLLSDAAPPQASGVSGPLVAGGELSGTQDVFFTATDRGSGVYSTQVEVDGHGYPPTLIDRNGGRCQPIGQSGDGLRDFAYGQPCKAQASVDIPFDARQLADGPHSLKVLLDDAAGNQATVYSGAIHTRAGASHVPNGSGACPTAHLAVGFASGTRARTRVNRSATLHGRLDCAGHPIAGAAVDLTMTPAAGRGAAAAVQLRTGADGTLAYTVPPGPSRRLTFSYRAFSDDATPSASAVAELLVAPEVALSITPRRTRNGRSITYRGRVYGGYIPARGLPLDVQYRDGHRWRTFDQVTAHAPDGRFVYHYRFKRTTVPIVYRFRVAIPAAGVSGYPYAPAASRERSVRVDP
jgi:hypothetical protein